jgi:TfoX/Sxy family transcriptional regulator of competence genes
MSAEALFQQVAAAYEGDPDVSLGRMFGSPGLKVGGKVFAMLVKDRLVLKLPADRVDGLIASGAGARFDPGHGKVMREWVAIAPTTAGGWLGFAAEAQSFVAAVR